MTVIDLAPQLDEIRLKYPEWWRSEQAQHELQALWGNTECNEHGVLQAQERIEIELPAQSQWKAAVKIARAPISVWNRTAYTTREEAIKAGINELKHKFEALRDWKGYSPESQTTNAARMIELLDQHLHQSRQMTLF